MFNKNEENLKIFDSIFQTLINIPKFQLGVISPDNVIFKPYWKYLKSNILYLQQTSISQLHATANEFETSSNLWL